MDIFLDRDFTNVLTSYHNLPLFGPSLCSSSKHFSTLPRQFQTVPSGDFFHFSIKSSFWECLIQHTFPPRSINSGSDFTFLRKSAYVVSPFENQFTVYQSLYPSFCRPATRSETPIPIDTKFGVMVKPTHAANYMVPR